jgi:tripartite-type tricarboxylate transporter receptor subunit TctC
MASGAYAASGLGYPSQPLAAVPYPSRPVHLILPFSPGGPADLVARLLSANIEVSLGQPFVVESRPGAASNIGTASVAKAESDGHTLLIAANNFMINPSIYRNLGYDPFNDFEPITELAASPCVIVAYSEAGIRTIDDLVKRDREMPGKLNYSTPGVGSPNHLVFELFSKRAGIKLTHVPYQGGAPATQAVVAGTTEIACSLLPNVLAHISSGALQPLAVTGLQRVPELPNTPTLAELGFQETAIEIMFMLLAPAKTPKDIVARLEAEAVRIFAKADVIERLRAVGFSSIARGAASLKTRIHSETALFKDLVPSIGIGQR